MFAWGILALLAALFAACVTVFAKVGLAHIDATLATAVRAIVMALLIVTVALLTGKTRLLDSLDRTALLWIVASGVAGGMSWLCYFLALRSGPAAGVAAMDRLSVVFVLILAAAWLGDPVTLRAAIGATLLIAGAALLAIG